MLFFFVICSYDLYSAATTWTVKKSGGGDFTSISVAISNAIPGDTIEIIDGEIYNENLVIFINTIILRGAPGQTPTIENQGSSHTITINNGITGVIIDNLIIKNNILMNTVYMSNASGNTIKNCKMTGSTSMGIGVYIIDGPNNKIVNCSISDFNNGIMLNSTSGSVSTYIFYNTIYNCNNAIYFQNFNGDQFIFNNTIVDNGTGININGPTVGGYYYYFKNNIINNSGDDLFLNINGTNSYNCNFANNCYVQVNNMNPGYIFENNEGGNINQDPQLNVDYTLMSGSPCIDAGVSIDYAAYGVSADVPAAIGPRDIGAHESSSSAPGAFETAKYVKLSANKLTPGKETTISIDLDKFGKDKVYVKASIYDLRGRLVKKLYEDSVLTSGPPNITWDGKNSFNQYVGSSVYLLKVQLDNIMRTRKIFFVK